MQYRPKALALGTERNEVRTQMTEGQSETIIEFRQTMAVRWYHADCYGDEVGDRACFAPKMTSDLN